MTEPERTDKTPPEPQGTFLGMPYDWRRPTWERAKARWWNPDEPRFLTPKTYGWGYDFNLYRVFHRR
ncbi:MULTISPECIES: hypothetical protein [unclassified Nocardia]|uniref:hypothetical protein n=1 Tax=unclassified Nocardia TaxID=2637762 RepID=UPI0035D61866